MINNRNTQFNGKAIALYLFQFSFIMPFTQVIEPQLFVAIVSSIIIFSILLKNRSLVINSQALKIVLFVLLLLIIKFFLRQIDLDFILSCAMYIVPVLCIFIFPFNYLSCLKFMFWLSKISFLLLFLIPFSSYYNANYMRFGYGMVPIVILAYIEFNYYFNATSNFVPMCCKKFMNLIIMAIGGLEVILYGARGCSFALLLFIILDYFIANHFNLFKSVVAIIFSLGLYFNLEFVFNILESIASRFGIFSYSLFKFKRQLLYGFEDASSGRNELYSSAIEQIMQYPLFGGEIKTDVLYFHNVFLQVGADFGIFAIGVIVVFLSYVVYLLGMKKSNKEEKLLLLILFSISFGRLMFSSSIWLRPEFWMLVFFVASIKYNKYFNYYSVTSKSLSSGTSV